MSIVKRQVIEVHEAILVLTRENLINAINCDGDAFLSFVVKIMDLNARLFIAVALLNGEITLDESRKL